MRNRLRPGQRTTRERPWQITTYLSQGEEPRRWHESDVQMGEGIVYQRRQDRLVIEMGPGLELTIAPGQRFAQRLAAGFTAIPDPIPPTEQDSTCPSCGAEVLFVQDPEGQDRVLDAQPDPNGIWLKAAEGRVRVIQPLEQPAAPTYRSHSCRRSQ